MARWRSIRRTRTPLGYGQFGAVSVVQVPGDGPHSTREAVPHGEVRIRPHESDPWARANDVVPPGYDQGKDYPVLLLHGAGDVESGWCSSGGRI
jgi:hypothetical protein